MYSVGQERRLVDPPSQVVAGVRTVTTNMDGRDALPRMSRPFAFLKRLLRNQSFQSDSVNVPRVRISPLVVVKPVVLRGQTSKNAQAGDFDGRRLTSQ
jgi:hypothetical protein